MGSARSAGALLSAARQCLQDGAWADRPAERYAAAHLAALRCAAAVLAVRAQPTSAQPASAQPRRAGRPARPASAWVLLAAVAPELGEWSAFFAAGAAKRQAAEAGSSHAVTEREADDLLRDAETFLAVCQTTTGAGASPPRRPLPQTG
ncbi:MAG: SAV_6107 family HEPN domain-containing protein [Mycobacteriales bacterium]|nr:MAG: hypothetical protein DLM56_06765 [Pseudonocardiales bacterium]